MTEQSPLSIQEQREAYKRHRQRSYALFGIYIAICLLVFLMAWTKM